MVSVRNVLVGLALAFTAYLAGRGLWWAGAELPHPLVAVATLGLYLGTTWFCIFWQPAGAYSGSADDASQGASSHAAEVLGAHAHHAERLKIAPISRETEFGSPTDIRDTFPHGNPAHARSPVAGGRSADFEPPRVIDGRFDPQYGTLLIVHFDRVLFHPMLDAHSFEAAFYVRAGFAAAAASSPQ